MEGARADLHVVGLQDQTASLGPIALQQKIKSWKVEAPGPILLVFIAALRLGRYPAREYMREPFAADRRACACGRTRQSWCSGRPNGTSNAGERAQKETTQGTALYNSAPNAALGAAFITLNQI